MSCSPGTVCISEVCSPREELLREVEFRGPRQVGDVARVNGERRCLRHCVHEIDRARERRRDVGIRFLVEADVRVAQLYEQGTAEPVRALRVGRRRGDIERGEYTARKHEQRARPAIGETAERPAARRGIERVIRHGHLRGLGVRTEDSAWLEFIPGSAVPLLALGGADEAHELQELGPAGVRHRAVAQDCLPPRRRGDSRCGWYPAAAPPSPAQLKTLITCAPC